MKKIFIKLFILVLVLFPILNVKAASTIKIERKTYITTGTRKEAKFYTNKGYAYCITPHRQGAEKGAVLKYYGKETKGELLYLVEKSGTSDYDYLTTQLAMWILKNNYMPDYYVNNPNLDVVKKAKSLAATASKQSNYQSIIPTVDISTNNINFAETSDGKYYKTGTIKITAKGYKEEPKVELVNAPRGTQIKELDTKFVNNVKRIEIEIPANSITENQKFQLKATVKGKVNHLEKYTTGNSNLQDLVVLVSEDKTVTRGINLTVSPVKRVCEYHNSKYYGKDGKIITKEEYEVQCESHVCEIVGSRYFGNDGKVTTKEEYEVQCESHVCEIVGSRYFGNDGKVTTKEEYEVQCKSHVCEIVGNKYFGKNGREVTELDYKDQCEPKQEVIVPDTNSEPISNIISIIIGSIMIGTFMGILTYYYGKKKINN